MTPEQAQYLDEVEARADRAFDSAEWSSDTAQSLVEVERLTALVRAYAGAWDELLSRVSDFGKGSVPVDDGIHAVVRWMLEIHLDKLP